MLDLLKPLWSTACNHFLPLELDHSVTKSGNKFMELGKENKQRKDDFEC